MAQEQSDHIGPSVDSFYIQFMKQNRFVLLILVASIFIGCRASKGAAEDKLTLDQVLKNPIFGKHFVGFGLYDPSLKKYLYTQNVDKYFTPASNTKILTLYSAMRILKDKISTFKYATRNDTIYIWGMGNPSFLNPWLPESHSELNYFKSINTVVSISNSHFMDDHFGDGWAWNDYKYAYQAEKSSLPIYGNMVAMTGEPFTKNFVMYPGFFNNFVDIDIDTTYDYGRMVRAPNENTFLYNYQLFDTIDNKREMPLLMGMDLLNNLIDDTIGIQLLPATVNIKDFEYVETLYSDTAIDSIYKRMMHISDNFIAEQLLLNCSAELFDTMNTSKVIDWIQDSLFKDIIDPFQWVDGSGLSRYNMFTPRSIIQLLSYIYALKPMAYIKDIFPGGGHSGTIESWYGSKEENPWIWAKTGSLRHNHCLSGYIQCDSGKILIFSFMHNHFISATSVVKNEMEKVLRLIRETN